jgi:hypothetical protein
MGAKLDRRITANSVPQTIPTIMAVTVIFKVITSPPADKEWKG